MRAMLLLVTLWILVAARADAQRDAYKLAREWLDNAIARIKPGASTAPINW